MIDTPLKWVIAILASIVLVGVFIGALFAANSLFYGGDRRCIVVHCVITK